MNSLIQCSLIIYQILQNFLFAIDCHAMCTLTSWNNIHDPIIDELTSLPLSRTLNNIYCHHQPSLSCLSFTCYSAINYQFMTLEHNQSIHRLHFATHLHAMKSLLVSKHEFAEHYRARAVEKVDLARFNKKATTHFQCHSTATTYHQKASYS